ncbi:AlpA family transcriptional regulator [Paraburkholderia sp. BL6665CI2N2]|uniref:helix-turn-helix transcriptional regulator n=1 Tax=Paraburkholderia sp. BL6665CI2N2 TaxID=1938806 RepID=UPI0010F2C0F2|nr:AlpA family phage regulatory protein [Paraburkholderia sp. BL6665CI2N2]TDY25997.1 AlpA family transcriptional regulator [Paraburkholderia sp. BL6665CI2N2]
MALKHLRISRALPPFVAAPQTAKSEPNSSVMARKHNDEYGRMSAPVAEAAPIDRIARLPEVLLITGLGRTTLLKMVREGRFPAPLHLSPRVRGWRICAVLAYIEAREKESRDAS